MKTDRRQLGQLRYLLRDCPRIAGRPDNVDYSRRALVKLLADYHECIGAPATVRYERSRADRRLQFLPLVGVVHTRLRYETERRRLAGVEFPGSNDLTFGFNLAMEIVPRAQSLTLYAELLYQRADFRDDHSFDALSGIRTTATQSARFSQLRQSIGLQVDVLPRSELLFVSLGLTNVRFFNLETLEEVTAPSVTDGEPFIEQYNAFGFHAGLGARIGNFRIMLRYGADNGFSNDQAVSAPLRYYRFLVGYSL